MNKFTKEQLEKREVHGKLEKKLIAKWLKKNKIKVFNQKDNNFDGQTGCTIKIRDILGG